MKLSDRHFGYWRDPICLSAAATYIGYRWLIPVAWQTPLWSGHFADLLLIPAGLPLWLWLERRIGWRSDDQMPRWREIAFALVTWAVAAELIAPRMFSQATGDVWDAMAYACGAVIAGLLWQRGYGSARRRGRLDASAGILAPRWVARVRTDRSRLSRSGRIATIALMSWGRYDRQLSPTRETRHGYLATVLGESRERN